ncbi:hypothetical protein BAUCODRAFT_373961 [Baudoinia panamericana UAMH 10762]|uniref:Uncharacterized protein n=1 Tax=Baudoinia panamericana (strain UAMH 10762) TaxID=717646 RepID=M2NMD2_BAUPA|nr:uncharacterized protein BAUCODRAFT_373961 [Baudoinia panamericana UAMH 10762]EMD00341.1 hypothetical protein BAUCODRAFT_373961 [Baudoinia panamericana UAMH 10762]
MQLTSCGSFTAFVYTTDVRPELQYLQPRVIAGLEFCACLSYLLDYYDALPQYSLFLHATEDQWHNDVFSKPTNQPDTLRSLRMENINAAGYVSLRCKPHPGCPPDIEPTTPAAPDGHV